MLAERNKETTLLRKKEEWEAKGIEGENKEKTMTQC